MQQPSQLGLIAMILGIIGLLMTFMGCSLPPLLTIGAILCATAVIMGVLEKKKISRGEAPEAGGQMALVGQITGGLGCGIQILFGVLGLIFVALYIVLIVVSIVLGGM